MRDLNVETAMNHYKQSVLVEDGLRKKLREMSQAFVQVGRSLSNHPERIMIEAEQFVIDTTGPREAPIGGRASEPIIEHVPYSLLSLEKTKEFVSDLMDVQRVKQEARQTLDEKGYGDWVLQVDKMR